MRDTANFELIEVLVNSGSTSQRIFFGDQPKLRNTALLGVETYSAENVTKAPSGNATINEDTFACSYLVLVDADTNEERVFNIPLVQLRRLHSQSSAGMYVVNLTGFTGMNVNYSKSYVFISDPTKVTAAQNESFCIGVSYEKRGAQKAIESSLRRR